MKYLINTTFRSLTLAALIRQLTCIRAANVSGGNVRKTSNLFWNFIVFSPFIIIFKSMANFKGL